MELHTQEVILAADNLIKHCPFSATHERNPVSRTLHPYLSCSVLQRCPRAVQQHLCSAMSEAYHAQCHHWRLRWGGLLAIQLTDTHVQGCATCMCADGGAPEPCLPRTTGNTCSTGRPAIIKLPQRGGSCVVALHYSLLGMVSRAFSFAPLFPPPVFVACCSLCQRHPGAIEQLVCGTLPQRHTAPRHYPHMW